MQIFMFVGFVVIEIRLFNRKKKKKQKKMKNMATLVKIEITCITSVLQAILDFFFQMSLASNMFSTLVLVEVKLSGN